MASTMNMTVGEPRRLLIRFAVPLLLSNICQSLYAVADSAVVGRFLGVEAFAAVGAAGTVSWMVIDIIIGLTQGFGVLFAQRFGGGETEMLKKALGNAIWLGAALGVLFTLAGMLGAGPMLRIIQTPPELLESATIYLCWLFGGATITMAYNLVGKLLSALGDSRTPLVAVILSSVLNVALDAVFIPVFHWGMTGVAASTVTAQLFSFLFCLRKLRGIPEVHLDKDAFKVDRTSMRELIRLGAPMGFRNGVISVGGLFVQWVINGFGVLFVAGTSAAQKYLDLLQLVAGALDGAVATYSAQNYGVGNFDRIRRGMSCACRIALVSAVITLGLTVVLGRSMIQWIVTGSPSDMEEVVALRAVAHGHHQQVAVSPFADACHRKNLFPVVICPVEATTHYST